MQKYYAMHVIIVLIDRPIDVRNGNDWRHYLSYNAIFYRLRFNVVKKKQKRLTQGLLYRLNHHDDK